MVNFMSQLPYSPIKESPPLDRGLGGPQSQSWCGGKDKKFLCYPWGESYPRHPACCLSAIMTNSPWCSRPHGPLKWWYPAATLHGITNQKASTWIFTAVKTSNLTSKRLCYTERTLDEETRTHSAVTIMQLPTAYFVDYVTGRKYVSSPKVSNFFFYVTHHTWFHVVRLILRTW